MLIAQPLGEPLRLAQVRQDPFELSERQQRETEIQADVDRLLRPDAALRETLERDEGLLEVRDRFTVGRARRGARRGLSQVGDRLAPLPAAQGVMGQAVDVLGEPVLVETLDRLGDPRVQGAPGLLE